MNRGGGGGGGGGPGVQGRGSPFPPTAGRMLRERPALAGQGPQLPAAPPCGQLASLCGSGLGGPGATALRPVSTLLCTVVLSKLAALAWSLLHLVVVRQAGCHQEAVPCPPGAQSSVSRGQPGACHRSGLGPLQETAWSVPCWLSGAGSREPAGAGEAASGSRWGPGPATTSAGAGRRRKEGVLVS